MAQGWAGKGSRHRTPDTQKFDLGWEMIFGTKRKVARWPDGEYRDSEDCIPTWWGDDYVIVEVPEFLFEEEFETELTQFLQGKLT